MRDREGRENRVGNRPTPRQNIIVPEAQNSKALLAQERVAARIILIVGVLGAVRLNDQPLLEANKVGDIGFDHLLSAELESR